MAVFTAFSGSVYARKVNTCPNDIKKELAHAATYVKVNYEVVDNSIYKTLSDGKDETKYKIPNYLFKISIYNISPDLSVSITENVLGSNTNVTYNMTNDGVYTFENDDFGRIYNYTFTVKSANSACMGSMIRTLRLTKPRYNAYSEFNYCKNSSTYYCQRFVGHDLSIKDTNDFLNKIDVNNKNEKEQNGEKTFVELFKEDWKLYASIFGVLLILFIALVIFLKWKNKRRGLKL